MILLTVEEVAERFRVCCETIRRMVKKNKIPHIRINKRIIRFENSSLEKWCEEKKL